MSCYSLKRLIKSFEETGSLEAKPRSGRPSTCKSVAVTVLQNAEAIETLSTYGEFLSRNIFKMASFGKLENFDLSKPEGWIAYLERINFYFVANGIEKIEQKKAILLTLIGPETFSLARSLAAPKPLNDIDYSELIKLLTGHFCPKPNVIVQRYHFNKRNQSTESVSAYVAELRKLSENCEFIDLDDRLRDRLVCGLRNEFLVKRLLSEKDLTFEKAVNLALCDESASADASILQEKMPELNVISKLNKFESPKFKPNKVNSNSFKKSVNKLVCIRCKGNHLPKVCKFQNAKCFKCGKIGHFQKACLTKTNNLTYLHDKNNSFSDPSLNSLKTDDEICPFYITANLDGNEIAMLIDSGSMYSILNKETYLKYWKMTQLSKSDVSLRTWASDKVKILGKLNVMAKVANCTKSVTILVADGLGPNILGRQWFGAFHLKINFLNINGSNPISPEFEELFKEEIDAYNGPLIHIDLPENAVPKFVKARAVPFALRELVDKKLKSLEEQGIIEPIKFSKWASPIVTVLKNDGTIRICHDYKTTVNLYTNPDKYPLPTIPQLLDRLRGGKVFTKLDMAQDYQQLKEDDESSEILTINTPRELYRVKRLPFGLNSAVGTFQRFMDTLLMGIDGVAVYLDDVLISGINCGDLKKKTEKVLLRFKEAGLRLKRNKCKFYVPEIEFLGMKIDNKGIHPSEEKLRAIKDARPPSNKKELMSFLGLLNYYERFLRNKATVVEPLHRLLDTHFDDNLPTLVSCDASEYGIGAILSQIDHGVERPVVFASRTLNKTERRYAVIDREALAVIFAVSKFYQYLLGRKFKILTDHKPLIGLFNPSKPIPQVLSPRMLRWCLTLSAYSYSIEYKPGRTNGNVDALSRLPLNESPSEVPNPPEVFFIESENAAVSSSEVAKLTNKDPILSRIKFWAMNGWPEQRYEEKFKDFSNRSSEISVHKDCLLWGSRVIIPEKLRRDILNLLHDTHVGIVGTKALARGLCWWPNMDKDIERLTFLKINSIRHILCAPYHAASNGQVERAIQTLKNLLRKNDNGDWSTRLARSLLTMRITINNTTQKSPAQLLMNRNLKCLLNKCHPEIVSEERNKQEEKFMRTWRPHRAVEEGQEIVARNYHGPKWLPGVVCEKTGPVSVKVETDDGRVINRHLDQVRSCGETEPLPSTSSTPQVPPESEETQDAPAIESPAEDLWEVVTENIPDEPKIEWKKKDSKARAIINLSIADSQIVHVKNLLTAKATWDTLKNIYERKTLSGKIYLLRKLYSLKLEEDKDMQQHITTMMELVDKLRTIGETLKDSHITAILLCSLPKSYSNLITMLESRPDDELTLEFTKNKLLDEHTRRVESSKDESTGSKALKSLHGASSQRREKEKKFCSFCHKPNHSKEECWHYQKRNNSNKEYKYENFRRGNVPKYTNQSSVTQEQSTNQRTTKGPDPKALNCTQREASVHNWFIDSGATSHMAYDESFFTELNREQTQNVVVANGNKLQVKGIGQGEIKVITPQGKTDTLLLTKVLYIPELTDNLLSVSAATSNGCKVTFNRDWCTIERDNTALANGILDNGMYRLHLDDNPQTRTFKANVAKQNHRKNKNCLMLWHDRLGHRNIESIKKIRNENLARGLSLNNCSHSTDCVQCIQGKLTETPFPKKTEYRATETLQLVHSDVCGPLPTNSLSGKRYFITFTDDYSRYTKIYLLKGKDEVYEKIKDYVISAHTEFGKNIQTIRTDNGREYVNRQVEDFLNQSGIKHQLTVPYSPAQNGVAERKNRSLMEMTRCMLFDSGLPQSLWAEAVTTANYLHNRIPSKATDKTPFELWTNRKPSLKHLKRFGCKAFAYIPKIKRNKLDSKVIEGIFLGYDDRSKGYRILHDTDNITISRSVKFIEKENGFHHASAKTTSPQVLSTDLTSSNHIGNAEESQEPGTQPENLEDSETEDYLQPGTSTGTQVVTQRRSTRPTKGIPPIRNDYMLYKTEAQDIPTPTSYSEVLQLPKIEREKWLQAMNEELNSLEKNHVWELTPLPKDKKIIGCKWTYKQKLNSKGEIERYKARLVAKGFNQKFGRDYEETFAPIVKHSTIRAFLAASVYKGMQVIHLDVKTAFLHGDLDKELYMELPEGLHTKQTNKVCKLKKAIYEHCRPMLFTKNEENHSIYLILYVDDMLLASDSEIIIQNTVKTLEKEFEIKNLGDPTQFIGIEISRNREGELLLSQKSKIQELVERYNLQEAKPTFTPMESGYPGISDVKLLPNNVQYQQLIGSLLYLSVVSRPDIAAPVCILSSRNQNPRNCDWNAAKRIVRYLKTTKELELRISNQKPPTLEAYSDATWASDNTDRKSLSGNLFLLGSNPISWMTGKQGCVSLSSTEAELISAAEASQELLWLLDLLKDLELEQKAPIYFHQDNQSCLKICSSEKVSSRTKHIATKIHHLKDLQKKTVIKMIYCPTGDMKADILTKPLPRPTFEKLRYNLVIIVDITRKQRHHCDDGERLKIASPPLLTLGHRVSHSMMQQKHSLWGLRRQQP
ncbi:K02A2.6-like, partial [Cordylochernes scorpioides]